MIFSVTTGNAHIRRAMAVTSQAAVLLAKYLFIYPALGISLLLALAVMLNGGNPGKMLLDGAENLLRDAPPGQVWREVPAAEPGETVPHAEGRPARIKQAASGDAWAYDTNRHFISLYQTVLGLIVVCRVFVFTLRSRVPSLPGRRA